MTGRIDDQEVVALLNPGNCVAQGMCGRCVIATIDHLIETEMVGRYEFAAAALRPGPPVLQIVREASLTWIEIEACHAFVGFDQRYRNMKINAGAVVTLNPGIYYLDGGDLTVNGGGTLQGTGVTLVFTSQNRNGFATASINGNAIVNLTPPTTGSTAGIVVFGDRRIPVGTDFKFNGGANQYLAGAIYVPTGSVSFAGGMGTSTSCTQLIGDTITFTGNSSFALNCNAYGTKPFSPLVVKLTS